MLATHRKFSEWHKERRLLLVRLCKDIQNDYRKRLDSLNSALIEPSERLKRALIEPSGSLNRAVRAPSESLQRALIGAKGSTDDYRKRERRKEAQMQKAKRDRLAALKSDDISSYRYSVYLLY